MSRGVDPVMVTIQGAIDFEVTINDIARIITNELEKSKIEYSVYGPEECYGPMGRNISTSLTLKSKR